MITKEEHRYYQLSGEEKAGFNAFENHIDNQIINAKDFPDISEVSKANVYLTTEAAEILMDKYAKEGWGVFIKIGNENIYLRIDKDD